ncbi:hypothetical protein [Tomitella cavernea]|uniref:Mce-associated membrane protein n=1 Tax=Tomitella cavernea TaxID=1387982 RepID=A0ABP9CEG2_9ACTN|nr:hypothetical protein [Tomitella cavernea]
MRGLRRRARGEDRTPVGDGADERAQDDAVAQDDSAAQDGPDTDGHVPASGTVGTPDAAPPERKPRAWLFPVVSGVVIVALLVAMSLLLWQRYGVSGPESAAGGTQGALQSPAIDVAEKVVLGVTNVNPDTVDANADEVLANSTGSFHDDYQAAQGQFATLVGKADATSAGTIVRSGLESLQGDTATVLVVVSTDVQNKALPEASQRGFRLRVTLEKEGNTYKVSNLEQVP